MSLWPSRHLVCIAWPLIVMGRHRRRKDKLLDRISAIYVLALDDLMAQRSQSAARRLKTIRRLESRWRLGASYPYRIAHFSYVLTSNFLLACIWQFLGYHLNSPFHPKGLSDTCQFFLDNPWLFVLSGLMALFFSAPPALDTTHIKPRPWSKFYGNRLQAAIDAVSGINMAPQ